MVRSASWRPTRAHVRAIAAGVVLVIAALAKNRPDLVVMASPLLIVAAWSVLARPAGRPTARRRLAVRTLREGEATYLHLELDDALGAHQVSAILRHTPYVDTRPRGRALTVDVGSSPQSTARLSFALRTVRWGEHMIGPGLVSASSAWGAYRWGPVLMEELKLLTLPAAPVFDARAPTPHPQGLVGMNRSVRPGDGSEFNTIRPFQVGDRLRRIHWPSSLRSQTLNVTSTFADHDSQVLVIVDAANDIGESGGLDGTPSTLDLTVRASAAVCEHYVQRGERVGMCVVGAANASIRRSGTGRAQLRRLLSSLAAVHPGGSTEPEDAEVRMRVEAGALVLMLSPLVSPTTLRRALALGRRGFTLVVIDTMPTELDHADDSELVRLAWRIRMLQRSVEMTQVAAAGIPVVPWRGPGSLDMILRDIGRRAAAPRLAHR
ncbi:MAG: DUF58 domain-containing protein [Nocardioidaceae bacterium]|nr:DUF58 domain-containing protein [Nocardioidaceae bacterium]